MSREIKYRAWSKKNNIMMVITELLWRAGKLIHIRGVYGDNKPLGGHADHIDIDKHLVLMQYTGLKDKNGVEIYEGDIYRWEAHNQKETGRIVFTDASFKCWVSSDVRNYDLHSMIINIEVIGNIFQNKNLLESEKG